MNRFVLGPLVFCIQEDEKLQLQEIAGYSGAAFSDWNRRLFSLRCDGHSLDGRDIICQEAQTGDDTLLFRLEAGNGMEILSMWSYDAETGVVSRRDSLHNTAVSCRMLERYFAEFPLLAGEYEGFWQRSFWCNENKGSWQSLAHAGDVVLSAFSGRVSEGNTPFLVLRDNYAMNAVAFHLIPCGNWNIRVRQESSGGTLPTLFAGFGQAADDFAFSLAPGETWESPEILIQPLPDRSATGGSAALHRYLLKHCCVPYRPAPVLYNTWLDRYRHLKPDRLRRQLAVARRIGCEAFVVDYGWIEEHNYFLRVGKWREKQGEAFDGKLAEYAEEVRHAGLQFGIWIEAEFFHESTPEIAEHPEWFARCRQNCWRLRLENPEAAAYFRDSIIEIIEKYHPTYIKNDMNHSQERDDDGSELAVYTRALHRIWSDLRRRFPEICFESCSSGGMRAGIEMLQDYDTYFISDNANSVDMLQIAQGMMLRLLPGRCSHWMVAAPLDS
ncbi:MAG: alpha-galactosidase, partial [Lentisphaeria bacterium]|nr:alpha-galactosidase [Lentisphaeria bacterium]